MLSERRRKEIASLSRKKYRTRLQQTIVEGLRGVEAALEGGAEVLDLVVTHQALVDEEVARLMTRAPAGVHEVDERTMQRLTGVETPPGILAVVATRQTTADQLQQQARILALDGVQDPGNVGTLLRTAAWFGIRGVVIGAGTADVFSPKVVRATMGALWKLELLEAADLPEALASLRKQGFFACGASLAGVSVAEWEPPERTVLVLGNEAHGIADATIAVLDAEVTIPGAERSATTESLNVATAGAVLMYEWTR